MRIEEIGNTLKNLLRKQNAGTVEETVIGKAILDAEKDLNSEGILAYKAKKYFHEIMKPFVVTEDVAFTSGIYASATAVLELLDVQVNDSGNKWPAKIVLEPSGFRVGSIEDVTEVSEGTQIPLTLFTKELAISAGVTLLPNYFVKALGGFLSLSGEDYKAVEIDPENWGSRDAKQIFGDLESPGDLNDLNIEEVEITPGAWTSGKTPVPSNFVKLLSVTSQVGSEKFDGIIVPANKFDSRSIADMANDGELKKHLILVPKTVALTAGTNGTATGDLPENFILEKQMFQAGDYEGLILDSTEFLDRKNCPILPPEEEYPIARIHDNKIEVAPDSISTIDLYAYNFPTDKQVIATVIGDNVAIEPSAPAENVILRYIKHPVAKRSVYKVHDGSLTVDPVPADFTLTYLEYPTEKAALVRNLNDRIEIKPESITSAEITYFKKMTPAVYAVQVRGDGKGYEFDSGNSTDTEFGEEATQYIVAKAAKYLGIPYKDAGVTSFEDLQQ